MSRRKAREEAPSATAAAPLVPEPAAATATGAGSVTPVVAIPPEEPTLADAPVAAVAAPTAAAASGARLPIDDYDSLRVNEILPKLDDLDLDELEQVAQHEESTKNRTTVLNRIDELMDQLEAEEVGTAATTEVVGSAAASSGEDLADAIETGQAVPEEAVSSGFPIPDYESRSEDEIVRMLADLDADELEEVAEYEETHANRDRVLDAIDDRLDELEGLAPGAPAEAALEPVTGFEPEAAATAPVRKTVAKKATAKKAVGKKATAATTKSATARPAKKAAAPTKRPAAVSKAAITVKKATAKKAAAATATSKRAATSVKKATPVKKVTAAKKATKAAKKSS